MRSRGQALLPPGLRGQRQGRAGGAGRRLGGGCRAQRRRAAGAGPGRRAGSMGAGALAICVSGEAREWGRGWGRGEAADRGRDGENGSSRGGGGWPPVKLGWVSCKRAVPGCFCAVRAAFVSFCGQLQPVTCFDNFSSYSIKSSSPKVA